MAHGAGVESARTKNERDKKEAEYFSYPQIGRHQVRHFVRSRDAQTMASTEASGEYLGQASKAEKQQQRHQSQDPESSLTSPSPQVPSPHSVAILRGMAGPRVEDDTIISNTIGKRISSGDSVAEIRSTALAFVKLFVVSYMRGAGVAGAPSTKAFLELCTPPWFSIVELSPAHLKHYVVEMYAATKEALSRGMSAAGDVEGVHGEAEGVAATDQETPVREALAGFHVSFEEWVSGRGDCCVDDGSNGAGNSSGGFMGDDIGGDVESVERYLGLRVSCLSEKFLPWSAVLAVKKVSGGGTVSLLSSASSMLRSASASAAASLEGTVRTHDTVEGSGRGRTSGEGQTFAPWVSSVLEEYGLPTNRLFSSSISAYREAPSAEWDGKKSGAAGRGRDARGLVYPKFLNEESRRERSMVHVLDAVLSKVCGSFMYTYLLYIGVFAWWVCDARCMACVCFIRSSVRKVGFVGVL